MIKNLSMIFSCFFCFSFAGNVHANYLAKNDGSVVSNQYCLQVKDIGQDPSDDLSRTLQVSANEIRFRNSFLTKRAPTCCVVLDTPKGVFKHQVADFYKGKYGIFVSLSGVNWMKESNPICNM